MKISVIIPVYNAQKFLIESVMSATDIDAVDEIILIEDGSNDESFNIAKDLENELKKVVLIQHFDKGNHGAAATRNLGVEKAKNEWIAFLDADDYYLPERFNKDIEIIEGDHKIDGVYSAVGTKFLDEKSKADFTNKIKIANSDHLTTISTEVLPKELFLYLIEGKGGYFCTDGVLVKKKLLLQVGCFDQSLRLHQDTHLWLKLAFCGKLVGGETKEPVAIRVVHSNNRITNRNTESQTLSWDSVFDWFKNKSLTKQELISLVIQYAFAYKGKFRIDYSKTRKLLIFNANLIGILMKNPKMLRIVVFPLTFIKTFKRLLS